jgi:hypothetical protein
MSALLQSPFMEDSIAEVVPDVAKIAGKLSSASVIQARRRVRLVPQSGQNYTVGASGGANTVNILIQDGQAYADLLSAVLSFEVQTADNTISLDDGAFSVFRRALVSVNSTLMDDIDFVPKKALAEIYATASQDWYNSVGSLCGLYKHSTTAFGTTSAIPIVGATGEGLVDKYASGAKAVQAGAITAVAPAPGTRNKFMVPVCLLSSFFRNEMLYPLRNAGQLYLQLNLASALEACVRTSGATVPSFTITNLTLEMDFVDLHPTYLAMMDEIMEKPGEDGVRWAFDAHLVSSQNLPDANGPQSVIVSKASQNMRSIQVVVQSQPGLSNPGYPKQSTFANPGFVDIQYRVGSLYFPAFTSIGEHRAFCDLQNAFGSPASLDKSGLADIRNYYNATKSDGSMPASYTGGAYQAYSDMWMHAYCFDRLKHATLRGLDLDGINTLTSSGSQIVVQLNANILAGLNEACVLTSVLRFTRVLEIKGGATRVIG